jgi:ADP-ribose pyrophosphatase
MAKGKSNAARVVSSKTSFRGPVFSVLTDMVEEPGGVLARRDVVRHPGSVVVLAVDDEGREPRILLERQYRHAAGTYLWELPAGHKDPRETDLSAAKRELQEETGFTAKEWKRILYFYVSPGFLDETMALFLARGLKSGTAQPEEDEKISIRFFPLSASLKLVDAGRILDAKTIAGVLWLATLGKRT